MPIYYPLKRVSDPNRKRIVAGLERLRAQLERDLPTRTINDTLLLATWNIRDFDSNKFKQGPRQKESLYYIAEIISAFDLVAVQELNWNLRPLKRLMGILGEPWNFITTDVTAGLSGNNERMAFVYDTRKVRFMNVAGEIVLPKSSKIMKELQFARTPFAVSFQTGWFKFNLCTVHLYFGASSGDKLQRRIFEIDHIARFLAKRAKKDKENVILLGDFNIKNPGDETMKPLLKRGFTVPEELQHPTNMMRDKYYDQIAFIVKENELRLGDSRPNAGVFELYKSVYSDQEWQTYHQAYGDVGKWGDQEQTDDALKRYYTHKWRTFQMSDHLPLWVELQIDFADDYLSGLKT